MLPPQIDRQEKGTEILFVDVRDPVEILFIGYTDVIDKNIPFKLVDRSDFMADKGRFAMGGGAKEGRKKGMRIVSGWQNDGLPWSMTLNPEKIYRP